VLEVYHDKKCSALLQAGDFFDSPRPPNFLMARYIDLLKKRGVVPWCVLGQHDVSMHNLESVERSAVNVFSASGVYEGLGHKPRELGDILVYGASWGQDIPTPERNSRAILVIHAMIGDRPLYPGHEPIRPKSFCHNHSGYELILCGDYHYPFTSTEDGRTITNCGALVRLNTRDRDLRPQVQVYDTNTKSLEVIEISYQPSEEVFTVSEENPTDCNESVVAFVERLRAEGQMSVSFRDNLVRFFETHQTPIGVRSEIYRILSEVEERE
jgi:DNA repair exonuclease SbcCD nuclease subunit